MLRQSDAPVTLTLSFNVIFKDSDTRRRVLAGERQANGELLYRLADQVATEGLTDHMMIIDGTELARGADAGARRFGLKRLGDALIFCGWLFLGFVSAWIVASVMPSF